MVGPAILALAEEGLAPVLQMGLVAAAVVLVPFAIIGPEAFAGWIRNLAQFGQSEAGGGHPFNQAITANLSLPSNLELVLLVGLIIVALLLVQAVRRKSGPEAAVSLALVLGLLLNPHSLIYDWTIAIVAVAFMRRSLSYQSDLVPGAVLVLLFVAGQRGWSTVYDDSLIKPLTLWGLAFVLLVSAPLLPRFAPWTRLPLRQPEPYDPAP